MSRYSDNSWEYKERPIHVGITVALVIGALVLGAMAFFVLQPNEKCVKSHFEHDYIAVTAKGKYVHVQGDYRCDEWKKL